MKENVGAVTVATDDFGLDELADDAEDGLDELIALVETLLEHNEVKDE